MVSVGGVLCLSGLLVCFAIPPPLFLYLTRFRVAGHVVSIFWPMRRYFVTWCSIGYKGLHGGYLYLRTTPLLAPVSTVGKPRLVAVAVQKAVQGAPSSLTFLRASSQVSSISFMSLSFRAIIVAVTLSTVGLSLIAWCQFAFFLGFLYITVATDFHVFERCNTESKSFYV